MIDWLIDKLLTDLLICLSIHRHVFNYFNSFLVIGIYTGKHYTTLYLAGLLVGRGKNSQISRDFQGQIRRKNGRFRGNFAGIFKASFDEKRLVKNGRFRESFPSKFRWKAIGFVLI